MPSMVLNIVSSSGGGRFDRDHAAATFWKVTLIRMGNGSGSGTYTDYPSELVNIRLFGID
jgi:hypothetical protein